MLNKKAVINKIKECNENIKEVINFYNNELESLYEKEYLTEIFQELGLEIRICTLCEKLIIAGFQVGDEYACTEACRDLIASDEEINDEDFCYETDWCEVNEDGTPIGVDLSEL